ncbi:carboxymuconolactone decarboxylase family protein [Mycobacterium deserti]|uniref:Carboxymuconolactone decarboxylase family protein n=1 Tax=Mycobacterium deserti TaxID=2978347 RepID=A0ABT2M7Q0_9MYCO|nr:carboxymuconolactone decarboxylase family protein [Mycobacterium deserti]MCT7657031.1 carboxymuconolactone decarboxylase family protein [Mycobacterium deserti]
MGGPDRLPLPSTLTADQRAAVEKIESGPRGALFGPFVPLLRSPHLMTRLQLVGEHLRFDAAIAPHLTELVILIVARRWGQDFEWGHHAPLARAAGLGDDVIAAIRDGADITGPDDVRAVWRLVDELENTRALSDSTFASALGTVGDTGVVEVIATVGYYTTLAMVMNAARTPVPHDYERLP